MDNDADLMLANGPCLACGNRFWFDPARVPSVPIDPATGLPPDLGGDLAAVVAQPVCPSCCKLANVERRLSGLALFSEEDTAHTKAFGPPPTP